MTDQPDIDAFINNIRPFDLLVFKGGDGISNIIRSLERKFTKLDTVSHVEIAIDFVHCTAMKAKNAADGRLFAWGSTMSGKLNDGVNDAETGGATFGVQLRDLRDELIAYSRNPNANVGYARLISNPVSREAGEDEAHYNNRMEHLTGKVNDAYQRYIHRGYDANPMALIGAIAPRTRVLRRLCECFSPARINNLLFCSEFVASLYIDLGIITDATDGVVDGQLLNPKDIVPVDFVGGESDINGVKVNICEPVVWLKK